MQFLAPHKCIDNSCTFVSAQVELFSLSASRELSPGALSALRSANHSSHVTQRQYKRRQSNIHTYMPAYINFSKFSSVRRSPTMRPQQDFSKFSCFCYCSQLLSCSFLVPLGLLSHYLSTSLGVFLCFLFPPLACIALLSVIYLKIHYDWHKIYEQDKTSYRYNILF